MTLTNDKCLLFSSNNNIIFLAKNEKEIHPQTVTFTL